MSDGHVVNTLRRFELYDWHLDFLAQQFTTSPFVTQFLFAKQHPQISQNDLLALIPETFKYRLLNIFTEVLDSGESQTVSVPMSSQQVAMALFEFLVEPSEGDNLQGTLRLLFAVPHTYQVADILQTAFASPFAAALLTDEDNVIISCNTSFEEKVGYQCANISGLNRSIFDSDDETADYMQELWDDARRNGYWQGPVLIQQASEEVKLQTMQVQKLPQIEGRDYYLSFFSDPPPEPVSAPAPSHNTGTITVSISDKEHFIDELSHVFDCSLEDEGYVVLVIKPTFVKRKIENYKQPFSQHLIDNDRVLICGYLGEGQFAICIRYRKTKNEQEARTIRNVMRKFVMQFKYSGSLVSKLLANSRIGVSVLGIDAKTPLSLMAHASQALLSLPETPGLKINFYNSQFHRTIERKKRLEIFVKDCIEKQEIRVYFQPVVSVVSGEIIRFVAQCQFPPLEGVDVQIDELVDVAEDIGLLNELDFTFNSLAILLLPEIQGKFGDHIGMEIDGATHASLDLVNVLYNVSEALELNAGSPADVTINLSERVYFDGIGRNLEMLEAVREAGLQISIDDFGMGYSSFSHLQEVYFDRINISPVYIRTLSPESNQFYVVKTLADLAGYLHVEVAASGIETPANFKALVNIGVKALIGGYFAPACPFSELMSDEWALHQQNEQLVSLANEVSEEVVTLHVLSSEKLPHMDAGNPISLAYQYLQEDHIHVLPVLVDKRCVGLVDSAHLNLHLTPAMGTEIETVKEHAIWHKPINQVMYTQFKTFDWQTDINQVPLFLHNGYPFPWVLVDENERYKGIIESGTILNYLNQNLPHLIAMEQEAAQGKQQGS